MPNTSTTLGALTTGRPIRRLFIDAETSPNVVLSWRVGYKINLDYDNIIKERAVICLAWKWEGEAKVHALSWDKDQNDRAMLAEFVKVIDQADEIVGHNLDQFDIPWFKTRCLYHGLVTDCDYRTVDTLQWCRRRFYFNSNRLDYVAKYLGVGGKIKTGFGLWKKVVLEKDAQALHDMVTYCRRDVELLEKVYNRLALVVKHKTHVGVLMGGDKWQCPRTGSTNVKVSKTRISAAGTPTYQMQSIDGGGYYTIGARAHAAYVEAKARSRAA